MSIARLSRAEFKIPTRQIPTRAFAALARSNHRHRARDVSIKISKRPLHAVERVIPRARRAPRRRR